MIREPNGGPDSLKDVCVAIIAEFYGPLSESVRRRCRGTSLEADVEDIVQEAFSGLWQVLFDGRLKELTVHNWRDVSNLCWIRKILFGSAKFARLKFHRHQRDAEVLDDPERVPAPAAACPVVLSEIEAAIQQCKPAEREAFLLKQQGFTNAEIAAQQNCEPGTVRTHCFRARICLKEILKDYA